MYISVCVCVCLSVCVKIYNIDIDRCFKRGCGRMSQVKPWTRTHPWPHPVTMLGSTGRWHRDVTSFSARTFYESVLLFQHANILSHLSLVNQVIVPAVYSTLVMYLRLIGVCTIFLVLIGINAVQLEQPLDIAALWWEKNNT